MAALSKRATCVCVMYVVYYDTTFFSRIISTIGAHNIDELIVVDGPRANAVPLLNATGMLYNGQTSPVRMYLERAIAEILPEAAITYEFRIWETQKHQRAYGFKHCTHDVMLQCEGDMIVRFNQDALQNFLEDDTHIAGVNVMNLIGSNAMMVGKLSDLGLYRFNLLVKRKLISHEDYFRSIWIVGSSGKPSAQVKYHLPLVGAGYHLTLVRSLETMVVKYAYYRALHGELANNATYTGIFNRMVNELSMVARMHGVRIARDLFVRSHNASALCIPEEFYIMKPPLPLHEFSPSESVLIDSMCNFSTIEKAPVQQMATYYGRVPLGGLKFRLHRIYWCFMTFTDHYYSRRPLVVLNVNFTSVKTMILLADPSLAGFYARTVRYLCQVHHDHVIGFVELHDKTPMETP